MTKLVNPNALGEGWKNGLLVGAWKGKYLLIGRVGQDIGDAERYSGERAARTARALEGVNRIVKIKKGKFSAFT